MLCPDRGGTARSARALIEAFGVGEGIRTHIFGLESRRSTIELHPRKVSFCRRIFPRWDNQGNDQFYLGLL